MSSQTFFSQFFPRALGSNFTYTTVNGGQNDQNRPRVEVRLNYANFTVWRRTQAFTFILIAGQPRHSVLNKPELPDAEHLLQRW